MEAPTVNGGQENRGIGSCMQEAGSSASPGLSGHKAWSWAARVTAHTHSGKVAGPAGPDFPAWGWMLTKPVTGQTCWPRSGQPGPLTR